MKKCAINFLILASGSLWAADNVQPLDVKVGLWEHTTVTQMNGIPGLTPEMLAKLPPDRRARFEAQMKAMNAPTVEKSCLTKDDLSKMFTSYNESSKSCKQTIVTSTGTKQEIRLECSTDNNKSTGTVTFEAVDSTHVRGGMTMNMSAGGNASDMKMTFTGKWIGPSCGDVKGRSGKE